MPHDATPNIWQPHQLLDMLPSDQPKPPEALVRVWLLAAEAMLERETGRHWGPRKDVEWVLPGNGKPEISLPDRVVELHSVGLGLTTLSFGDTFQALTADEYRLEGERMLVRELAGELSLRGGRWPTRLEGTVIVEATIGYAPDDAEAPDPYPGDVRGLLSRLVVSKARRWRLGDITSYQVGDLRVALQSDEVRVRQEELDHIDGAQAILRRYRVNQTRLAR